MNFFFVSYYNKLEVFYTIGGGYVLKSDIIPYPESASRSLEICAEVFVDNNDQEKALEAFVNFVNNLFHEFCKSFFI